MTTGITSATKASVDRGSGASYQAVARLQAAKPVGRDVVLKVALWWVLERQRSKAELEQAA